MKYDLQSQLDKVYATYPEAKRQPIIGITTNFTEGDATLRDVYYKQIVKGWWNACSYTTCCR